ncbi:hypothetical protein RHGRI_020622 [Rhododendron griersonianum]|uniref:RING-type domain-containing protein n=1 Tax=Rhododendron griersonianum TaxID=479676 RepID=A0AAV6JPH5_9ERIC|nr:hypothetical protein RHGRI_020622 [Rhododendron griersonianum]
MLGAYPLGIKILKVVLHAFRSFPWDIQYSHRAGLWPTDVVGFVRHSCRAGLERSQAGIGGSEMGSSSSKPNAAGESSSASSSRSRCKGSGVFQSSCLSGSHHTDNDDQNEEHSCKGPSENQIKLHSDQVKADCYGKFQAEQSDEAACMPSNSDLHEWGQSNLMDTIPRAGSSSSQAFSSRSLHPSGRFLSRFNFIPGNVSFRLSRATSLGSSRQGLDYEDFGSRNLESHPTATGFSESLQCDQNTSGLNVARDINNGVELNFFNSHSPRVQNDVESMETRFPDRRIVAREPLERNVHFSRTRSVGRLRERVLRRSFFPDLTFSPLQQESDVTGASRHGGTDALDGGTGDLASNENALISSTSSAYPSSGMSNSSSSGRDFEGETSRVREVRYHDLLEHRSNFLERRRRIRSQVRALQRLGSRFENLSGHERSCIISGQNRSGRCSCRISTRDANSNDDTGARASISRIVMLAEALFEVLDEIHQQSVVLSYRPSVSSIGSVPAPNEVVESLPLKLYSKSRNHLNEEAAQCYICLVEYEEGDNVRILPCHHEFHRTCVDKWLKEIHRVCPLCRGDICRTDLVPDR